MKLFSKLTIIAALILLMSAAVDAQKIGYINASAFLQEFPEVKAANSQLETLKKQLTTKGQGMVEELQQKYQDLQKKEQLGELSPKQLETEALTLKEEEEAIQKFDQDMTKQLQQKQQTLLQPILDKVNTAISEVAKEEDFTYILDASSGVLLYADEAMDITEKVKTKLDM